MQAGKLRSQITITRDALTGQDAMGSPIRVSSSLAAWWAEITPTTGKDAQFALTFAPTVSHKIMIRYLAGLLDTDKIVFGSRLFAINGILDMDGRKREMTLYCTELEIGGTQTLPSVTFDTLTDEQFNGLM